MSTTIRMAGQRWRTARVVATPSRCGITKSAPTTSGDVRGRNGVQRLNGITPVLAAGDHRQVWLGIQGLTHRLPDQVMVLRDQHLDHCTPDDPAGPSGPRSMMFLCPDAAVTACERLSSLLLVA